MIKNVILLKLVLIFVVVGILIGCTYSKEPTSVSDSTNGELGLSSDTSMVNPVSIDTLEDLTKFFNTDFTNAEIVQLYALQGANPKVVEGSTTLSIMFQADVSSFLQYHENRHCCCVNCRTMSDEWCEDKYRKVEENCIRFFNNSVVKEDIEEVLHYSIEGLQYDWFLNGENCGTIVDISWMVCTMDYYGEKGTYIIMVVKDLPATITLGEIRNVIRSSAANLK